MLLSAIKSLCCAGLLMLGSTLLAGSDQTGPASKHMRGGFYKGAGEWKNLNGGKGFYTATLDVAPLDNDQEACKITGSVTVTDESNNEQTESWSSIVRHADHGTFNVFDLDNNKIGDAYCFSKEEMTLCHMNIEVKKGEFVISLEESLHFSEGGIGRMGSKTMSGTKIMFFDYLTPSEK